MIAIGDEISRDGERWRLIGVSPDGHWIATRLDEFGPNIALSARDLAAFGIEPSNPRTPSDETAGWRALSDSAREKLARKGTPSNAPSPEEIFREVADAADDPKAGDGRRNGLTVSRAQSLGHKG